jgi:hypothetical protein
MRIFLNKGKVRSFTTLYTQDTSVNAEDKTRSITFINQGITNVTIGQEPNGVILVPNASFVLGGFDDCFRSEDLQIIFTGGTGMLKVVRDKEIQAPYYYTEDTPEYIKN